MEKIEYFCEKFQCPKMLEDSENSDNSPILEIY